MVLSDRSLNYLRSKSVNSDVNYGRNEFSYSNFRNGRMHARPSIKWHSIFDRSNNSLMSRQSSLHDLTFSTEMKESMASPINGRNSSLRKIRNNAWRELSRAFDDMSIPIYRSTFNGYELSFNEDFMKPASYLPSLPRYRPIRDQSSPMRDLLLNEERAASPTLYRNNLYHLTNEYEPWLENNWHISSSTIDTFSSINRPRLTRLRGKPLLFKINPAFRSKAPLIKVSTPSSGSTKLDISLKPELREGVSGQYRNQEIPEIKIGCDEREVSKKSNLEFKVKEVIAPELLNKILDLREIQKEIKNQSS